jgi:hypothetical protein
MWGAPPGGRGRLPVEANGLWRTPQASGVPIRIPRACVLGASGVSSGWFAAADVGERRSRRRASDRGAGERMGAPRTDGTRVPPRVA